MDIFLFPVKFWVWAAISFLLLLQAIMTKNNILYFASMTTRVIKQAFHWMGFLFWMFMTSYTEPFWWSILHWIFIAPIILFTFFRNIYNFGPKHCKQSLFEILCNPVPGIEFAGRLAESDDFDSLKRCCFNHNPIAQHIARIKYLAAKRATRSSTIIVYNCPLSYINACAPKLHGYERMQLFMIHQDIRMLQHWHIVCPWHYTLLFLNSHVPRLYFCPYHNTHQMDLSHPLWFWLWFQWSLQISRQVHALK